MAITTATPEHRPVLLRTIEVAVVEYEGGDRLNVPLYRIDQLERYRSAGDVSDDAPPPRLHKLGGKRWAQQRDRPCTPLYGQVDPGVKGDCSSETDAEGAFGAAMK